MKDLLKIPKAGDPVSASQQEIIVKMLRAVTNGADCFVDSGGVHFRRRAGGGSNRHWGHLESALLSTDTDGVTVTLDIGGTKEGVLYPPDWPSGTIASNARVLIDQIDGAWYVILTPCAV